ncbi:MAG: GDP-mannose 4,6-dehydratase, partial [Lentisphaeria bacterium]|nr:GDP-mannose 4,6-dehydratase [Lentisphaeria bacterium]
NIFIDTNVTGTLNLLKVARDMKLQRFLQVSTDEVYGSLEPDDPAFDENNSIIPSSPYAASKASADHLVHAFNHTFGLNTVITRCSNNYGPYQFPEKMLPLMFNNARHDKDLPVYGDGLQIRDWLYVYDHCTAIWTSFKNAESGSVYNIGGGNEKTNLEVIKAILSFLDKPESLITHVTDRLGHDRRYAINAEKAMSELGWEPTVKFEQGLEKTLNWYLENTEWINSVTSGDYQNYYEQMYANR